MGEGDGVRSPMVQTGPLTSKSGWFPGAASLETCSPAMSGGTLLGGLWPHSGAPDAIHGNGTARREGRLSGNRPQEPGRRLTSSL